MGIMDRQWCTHRDFSDEYAELSKINSVEYFESSSPRIRLLRDAYIADNFARKIGADKVRMLRDWPDFEIRMKDGSELVCEATEVQYPGRRRADEYRRWRSLGWPPVHVSQEEIEARRAALPSALLQATRKKVAKRYPQGIAALVIYLNIACYYHDDDEFPDFSELTKQAHGPFNSVLDYAS